MKNKGKGTTGQKPAKTSETAEQQMKRVDLLVKQEGERDVGAPPLNLCPRCGSTDIGIRRIDIPGFAPEVYVCNRCGFRSEGVVQVPHPIEYFEEVEEEDSSMESKLAEIEKRLQGANYVKGGKVKSDKPTKPLKAKPQANKQKPVKHSKLIKQKVKKK